MKLDFLLQIGCWSMRPLGGDTLNLELNVTFQAKLLIDRIVFFDNLQLLCACKCKTKDFSDNI